MKCEVYKISWDEKYIVVNSIPLQHIAHRTSVYCQRSFQRSNRTDKQNSADIKLTGWRGNCMGGKARQGNRIPLRGFNSDACQPTLVPCLRQDEHVASPTLSTFRRLVRATITSLMTQLQVVPSCGRQLIGGVPTADLDPPSAMSRTCISKYKYG